jgi:hypothetical protein
MYDDIPIPVGPLALGAGATAAGLGAGAVSLLGVDVPMFALVAAAIATLGGLTVLARRLSLRRR